MSAVMAVVIGPSLLLLARTAIQVKAQSHTLSDPEWCIRLRRPAFSPPAFVTPSERRLHHVPSALDERVIEIKHDDWPAQAEHLSTLALIAAAR
jgi:hypothetical protein